MASCSSSEEDVENRLSKMSVDDEESLLKSSRSLRLTSNAAVAHLETGLDLVLKKENALKSELEVAEAANTAVLQELQRVEAENKAMEAKMKASKEEEAKYLDDYEESREKEFQNALSLMEDHVQHLKSKLESEEEKTADFQEKCEGIVDHYQNIYDELCRKHSATRLTEENRPKSRQRSEKSAGHEIKAAINATIVEIAKTYVNMLKPSVEKSVEKSSEDVIMESQVAPTPGTAIVSQLTDLQLASQATCSPSFNVQDEFKEADVNETSTPCKAFDTDKSDAEDFVMPDNPQTQSEFVPDFFGSADCQSQQAVQSSAHNKNSFADNFTFEF